MLSSRSTQRLTQCAPKRFYSGGPPPWRPVSALDEYDSQHLGLSDSGRVHPQRLTLRALQMGRTPDPSD